jgi:hypothetical protein
MPIIDAEDTVVSIIKERDIALSTNVSLTTQLKKSNDQIKILLTNEGNLEEQIRLLNPPKKDAGTQTGEEEDGKKVKIKAHFKKGERKPDGSIVTADEEVVELDDPGLSMKDIALMENKIRTAGTKLAAHVYLKSISE